METPALAMPRIPHDVIFAIGGWSEGRPQSFIETYDTRADRWINIPYEDHAGPRGYHGTAVIGYKIYCIGGFDGNTQFNVCREFDAENKIWEEVTLINEYFFLIFRKNMCNIPQYKLNIISIICLNVIKQTESSNALQSMLCKCCRIEWIYIFHGRI